jgi:hypothetical protein
MFSDEVAHALMAGGSLVFLLVVIDTVVTCRRIRRATYISERPDDVEVEVVVVMLVVATRQRNDIFTDALLCRTLVDTKDDRGPRRQPRRQVEARRRSFR